MTISVAIAALALTLSFPNVFFPSGYWPLAWMGTAFLFPSLENKNIRQRLGAGILFGLLFYGLILRWFIPYSPAGYLFFIAALSLQPVLFSVLYGWGPRSSRRQVLFVPALWVATEYLRRLFLNGFSWDLGHSQTFQPEVLQWAALTGSGGISFVLVLTGFCFHKLLKRTSSKKFYVLVILTVISLVFGVGRALLVVRSRAPAPRRGVNGLIIQPDIGFQEKGDEIRLGGMVDRLVSLTGQGIRRFKPDLVVWPETALPVDFRKDPALLARVRSLARKIGGYFLFGAALTEDGRHFNSAVLMDKRGEIVDIYRKRELVPFSEYTPSGSLWRAAGKLLRVRSYDFTAGRDPGLFVLNIPASGGRLIPVRLGVLICSEDTIGSLFREYRSLGAGLIIVLLNDGWFHAREALIMHAQNALMHAVESRQTVVRAANTGWTVAADPFGRTSPGWGVALNKPALIPFRVESYDGTTFYHRTGDTFCFLCLGFVIIFILNPGSKNDDL